MDEKDKQAILLINALIPFARFYETWKDKGYPTEGCFVGLDMRVEGKEREITIKNLKLAYDLVDAFNKEWEKKEKEKEKKQ